MVRVNGFTDSTIVGTRFHIATMLDVDNYCTPYNSVYSKLIIRIDSWLSCRCRNVVLALAVMGSSQASKVSGFSHRPLGLPFSFLV